MNFYSDRHADRIEDIGKLLNCWARADGDPAALRELYVGELSRLRASAVGATTLAGVDSNYGDGVGALIVAAMEHGPGAWPTIAAASRRAAFRTPLFVGTGVTAEVVGEGVAVRAKSWGTAAAGLTPTKVAALTGVTREAMGTAQGRQGVALDLIEALTTATDKELVSTLATSGTSVVATSDPVADLRDLLASVTFSGASRPFWIMSPQVASALATWTGTLGQYLYPDISPTGGSLFGVPALVTTGADADLALVDATALITGDTSATVTISSDASIELDDAADQDSVTPSAPSGKVISLFQTDTLGILGTHSFGLLLTRTSGAAILSGAAQAWGAIEAETT